MKRWQRRVLISGGVLMVAGGLFSVAHTARVGGKEAAPYVTASVSRGDVRAFVSATGVLQAWKVVDVKSDVSGRIDKLAVDLGDHVRAGQLIALIDPTDTRTAAIQARADLDAADAKRAQAVTDEDWERATARAHIAGAQRAVQEARAKALQAKAAMEAQPALTRASIGEAQAAVSSEQRALAQARESRSELEAELQQLQDVTLPLNLQTAQNELSQATAGVKTLQAEYQRERQLVGQGYAAPSDMEAAYARYSTAEATAKTAAERERTIRRENELSQLQLQAKIRQAGAAVQAQEEKIRQAQAALELARSGGVQDELKRQDYQAAAAGVKQAEAQLAGAKAELRQVTVKQKDVLAAQDAIVKNQAALRQAETNLSYTRILAPRDGVVLTKNVEEGTVVPSSRASIGSTNALVQIGDTSRLWVVCNVDETDIGQIRQGADVSVVLDAYPDTPARGKVVRIDPQAVVQQSVTLIPVTVELAGADPRFKPGMNATCQFIQGEAKEVLTVPNEAVKSGRRSGEKGASYVQVLVQGRPQRTPVQVGLVGADMTEIKSGLREGQLVITKELQPRKHAGSGGNPLAGGLGGPGGGRMR